MRARAPGLITRTAWLMLGAAIGLAAVLLAMSVAQLLAESTAVPEQAITAACLLLVPLLALVPGARELEVTAARSMLRVFGELVDSSDTAAHRWRTAGWVVLHLGAGLVAGFLVFGVLPGGVAVVVSVVTGAADLLLRVGLPVPDGAVEKLIMVGLAVLAVAASMLAVWATGVLAARLAPVFLGPTPGDRLALAEARLATEVEHTRLARELHDGIGHALTIISVQAAAGRRLAEAQAGEPTTALQVIETTARQALDELDSMLGVLRDRPARTSPEPDLARLADLVAVHRAGEMRLRVSSDLVAGLPPVVSRSAYRILAEALANAQRHAGAGEVSLDVRRRQNALELRVSSPLPAAWRSRDVRDARTGHGLQGITERVRLLGGSVEFGPDEGYWRVHAILPTGEPNG